MIQYEKDNTLFVHRVAAVIVDADRVLLHHTAVDDFWSLPGGQAELMEPSAEGIRREMHAELNIEVRVERLLWVVETFYRSPGERGGQGQNYHEVGLYFLCSLHADTPLLAAGGPFSAHRESPTGQPLELVYQWFPRTSAALTEIHLAPEFLRAGLVDLPAETKLVVNQVTKT